jgi:hypothetical protein
MMAGHENMRFSILERIDRACSAVMEERVCFRCCRTVKQVLNAVSNGEKSGAVPPRPALGPLGWINEKFAAFLRQIGPFVPVLPIYPAYKYFAVNKTHALSYLDT